MSNKRNPALAQQRRVKKRRRWQKQLHALTKRRERILCYMELKAYTELQRSMPPVGCHPSHVTRFSFDASSYDEICVNCGATDIILGGWGELTNPCPKPVGQGGVTIEEYHERGSRET